MKVNGKEVDLVGQAVGIGLLVLASPAIAMVLWLWFGAVCFVAWLWVGPIDYCVATYLNK